MVVIVGHTPKLSWCASCFSFWQNFRFEEIKLCSECCSDRFVGQAICKCDIQNVVWTFLWYQKPEEAIFGTEIKNFGKLFLWNFDKLQFIVKSGYLWIYVNYNLNRNLINIFMFVTPMCEWNPNIFPSFEYHTNLRIIQQNLKLLSCPDTSRTSNEPTLKHFYFELSSNIMISTSPFCFVHIFFNHFSFSHIFHFLYFWTDKTNEPSIWFQILAWNITLHELFFHHFKIWRLSKLLFHLTCHLICTSNI